MATGGIDSWNNANVKEGVFWSDYHTWTKLSNTYLEAKDVVDVASNPFNSNEAFIATWNDGLMQLSWSDENTRFEKKTAQYNHYNTNGHLATLNADTSSIYMDGFE